MKQTTTEIYQVNKAYWNQECNIRLVYYQPYIKDYNNLGKEPPFKNTNISIPLIKCFYLFDRLDKKSYNEFIKIIAKYSKNLKTQSNNSVYYQGLPFVINFLYSLYKTIKNKMIDKLNFEEFISIYKSLTSHDLKEIFFNYIKRIFPEASMNMVFIKTL